MYVKAFISYGKHGNEPLIHLYGFAIPDNSEEIYNFVDPLQVGTTTRLLFGGLFSIWAHSAFFPMRPPAVVDRDRRVLARREGRLPAGRFAPNWVHNLRSPHRPLTAPS